MKVTAETVQGFIGSVLIKRFDDAATIPQFHLDLWRYACSDEKYVAIAAPRGHAKSTAGTLAYGLASLLFRESRYMVVVSDTEAQAAMFLASFKQELSDNEAIADLFGLEKDSKGVRFYKDNETALECAFVDGQRFRVIAKGAEQKLRGLLWDGRRPDLLICDDLENDELVMNQERREKLKRWFYGALIPALSPKGKVRIWGTILHSAALLEQLMPVEGSRDTVTEPLKQWSKKKHGQWVSVKYRAHTDDFSEVLWPGRFDAQYFREKLQDAKVQGLSDVYSQEYLNRPIDDSVAYFKRRDFLPVTEDDKKLPLEIYITADLAISQKEKADYSVFVVGGMDEDRRLHIIEVIRDRLDGREIVDLLMALQRTYEPVAIGIEEMQVSQSLGPFIREEMIAQNVWPNIINMKHMGKDKVSRARSIQARVRAKTVKFDKEADWFTSFEDELVKFPRGANDDQVDAFAYLGMLLDKMVEAPTKEDIEEEEYADEVRESGWNYAGRNATTGY